jgi:hypothetical protein
MRYFLIICLLGSAAFSVLHGQVPEKYEDPNWDHENHEDPTYGTSIVVIPKPMDQRKGNNWGSGTYRIDHEREQDVAVGVLEDDLRTQTARLPLTEHTIAHMIEDSTEPQYLRFLAVSNIMESPLDTVTKRRLLTASTMIPASWLRSYAWHEVFEFMSEGDDFSHPERVLFDPCLDIPHEYLSRLIRHFHLRAPDGNPIQVTTMWRGALIHYYHCEFTETLAVAEALKASHPELVEESDLAVLRGRKLPSEIWLRYNFGENAAKMLEYYKEHFHP